MNKSSQRTKVAVDIFNKYANDYQTKFMDVSLYSKGLDVFLRLHKKT